jgi:hypothetical protein
MGGCHHISGQDIAPGSHIPQFQSHSQYRYGAIGIRDQTDPFRPGADAPKPSYEPQRGSLPPSLFSLVAGNVDLHKIGGTLVARYLFTADIRNPPAFEKPRRLFSRCMGVIQKFIDVNYLL